MNNDIERYQFWKSELNNNSNQVQTEEANNLNVNDELVDLEEEEEEK